MLLNFKFSKDGFKCLNPETSSTAISVNYIKCHFDVSDSDLANVDAICAIFKSATFNVHAEVMLDSNNNCYIDPEVYKRGGVIQVKLVGDKYIPGEMVISSTHVTPLVEFAIRENIILPTVTPSKYDVFVAELEQAEESVETLVADITQKLDNGEFDGVGITSVAYNADGTVTVTLTDGTSFVSEYSMKGAKGDTGDDGVGIDDVQYGEDGTLTILLSDGTTFVSEYSMKGEKGDKGDPGDKGDSFTYGDFTQEQLDDLAEAATPNFGLGTVTTLDAGSQATATITGTPQNPALNLGIPKGVKGDTGAAAGFGTVTATVDANIGTPSVTVTPSGTDASKNFNFEFHNLKGAKGDKGDKGDPGSGGGGISLVTFTYDEEHDTWSADKSVQDLYDDWLDGMVLIGRVQNTDDADVQDVFYELVEIGMRNSRATLNFKSVYTDIYNDGFDLYKELLVYADEGDVDIIYYHDYETHLIPSSRTINGKPLTSNIILTPSDVSALPSWTVIPTYTAGTGIDITNGVISIDLDNAEGSNY